MPDIVLSVVISNQSGYKELFIFPPAFFKQAVQLFNSVKVTELPPVCERAANSAYHLLFLCLL